MNFDTLFANPKGRTGQKLFVPALLVLLLAMAVYGFYTRGRTGQWCLLVLLAPALVLHARRLHDMGKSAILLLVPVVLVAGGIYLRIARRGSQIEVAVTLAALASCALFALWGLIGKGQAEANKYGEPA